LAGQQIDERRESQLLLPLRTDIRRRVATTKWNRKQWRDQRNRVVRLGAPLRQHVFELFELVIGTIAALNGSGALQLFDRTRSHVAEILEAKEREGVLSLRFGAEAIVSYLFALGDGFALQALSEPGRDIDEALAAGAASARFLLAAE